MKGFGKSFLIAFSEYSISPKTKLKTSKETASFVLVFLPLIGLIITVIINRWAVLYPYMCDHPVLPAIFGVVVPIILSAGSHLGGFFKTVDALSSRKSKEEKLDIITKDEHGGYSSMVACICLFMVSIGLWSEMPIDGIFVIAFAYIISRALAGISLLTMKHSDNDSAVSYVPDSQTSKWIQVLINLGYIAVCAVLMIDIADSFYNIPVAVASLVGALLSYVYYIYIAKKHFGGVSKELGGFFITVCEVIIPLAALFVFKKPF